MTPTFSNSLSESSNWFRRSGSEFNTKNIIHKKPSIEHVLIRTTCPLVPPFGGMLLIVIYGTWLHFLSAIKNMLICIYKTLNNFFFWLYFDVSTHTRNSIYKSNQIQKSNEGNLIAVFHLTVTLSVKL